VPAAEVIAAMTQDKKQKTAARALAASKGLAYADALRHVRAVRVQEPDQVSRLMTERGLDQAAAAELDEQVRALMDEDDEQFETYTEALAWLDDPANEVMCQVCGWTRGMVCPECAQGCGCSTDCAGWRHQEWGGAEDVDEDGEFYCSECGAVAGLYEECQCG
jgi:hypothetical protein